MQCLAWIHIRCVSEAEEAWRSVEWPHRGCFLLLGTPAKLPARQEQQGLLLCSGFAGTWQVPRGAQWSRSLGMREGGNPAYMYNILRAMGRERCWGMGTVLGLTFSLDTACNPRPHNIKSPKIACVQQWYWRVSLPLFPSPKHRNSLTITQGYTEPPGANICFTSSTSYLLIFFSC